MSSLLMSLPCSRVQIEVVSAATAASCTQPRAVNYLYALNQAIGVYLASLRLPRERLAFRCREKLSIHARTTNAGLPDVWFCMNRKRTDQRPNVEGLEIALSIPRHMYFGQSCVNVAQTCQIPGTVLAQTSSESYVSFIFFNDRIVWSPKHHSLSGSCHEAA